MDCINHPNKEAKGYCSKHDKYMCEDCMKCQDPGLYCKFRKQCIVWEFERHGMGEDFVTAKEAKAAEAEPGQLPPVKQDKE